MLLCPVVSAVPVASPLCLDAVSLKVKVDLLRCPGLLYVQAPSDIKFLKATMTMLLMVQYQG